MTMIILEDTIHIQFELYGFQSEIHTFDTADSFRHWLDESIKLHDLITSDNVPANYRIGVPSRSTRLNNLSINLKKFREKIEGVEKLETLSTYSSTFPQDMEFGHDGSLGEFFKYTMVTDPALAVNVAERLFGELSVAEQANYTPTVKARAIYMLGDLSAGSWKPENAGSLPHFQSYEKFKSKMLDLVVQADAELEAAKKHREASSEFMKLEEPKKYWQSKANKHREGEGRLSKFLIAFFALSGILITSGLFLTFYYAKTLTNQDIAITLFQAGLTATLTTLAIWVGRLLTRAYLSEKHLAMDAEERAVMIETWLSMTRDSEPGTTDPKDRQIVLASLFRPTEDGIVKDDAAPLLDVTKLISAK